MIDDDDTTTNGDAVEDDSETAAAFDLDEIREDAREGAKALAYLFDNKTKDWDRWVLSIRGLRGLRDMAFHKIGQRCKLTDYNYRQEIGRLLSQRQYAVYDRLSKTQRHACYKLMDNLEDVDDWYHGRGSFQGYPISDDDRMNWKSPETIIKHCPAQLLEGGEKKRVQAPKPKLPKPVKPEAQAEIDRLRALVMELFNIVITAPDLASARESVQKLVQRIMPPKPAEDSVDDLFGGEDDE